MAEGPKVFISYRRDDSAGHAGRLAADMRRYFGEEKVFFDLVDITSGEEFPQKIKSALGECRALLAVIGPRWLDQHDEARRRRLDQEDDIVRMEIATALEQGLVVIPVLVQGAKIPKREYLPESIQPLAEKNAHDLSDTRWDQDVASLAGVLEKKARMRPSQVNNIAVAPNRLQSDLPDFIGRLDQIDWLIRQFREAGGIVALDGMGGVGKTALAVHVAHLLHGEYPSGQIRVDLKGLSDRPLTTVEAMHEIIRALEPEMGMIYEPGALHDSFHELLQGKRVLLLLDNARNGAQVRDLLPPPPCGVIVTSRKALAFPGMQSLNLEVLIEGEAVELLETIIGPEKADRSEIKELAKRCGYLPLALRVAGSFLAVRRDWTVAEYLVELADERQRLELLRHEDLDVGAVLGLSASQLVRQQVDLAARWQELTVFPGSFDRIAAAAVWQTTKVEAHRALSRLLEEALILFEPDSSRYSFHDLMRPVAMAVFGYGGGMRDLAAEEERLELARSRMAVCYLTVLRVANKSYLQGGEGVKTGLSLFDLEGENIRAGQAWSVSKAGSDDQAAGWVSDYIGNGSHILSLRLNNMDWISWLEAGLASARKLGDRANEGAHLGKLGVVYWKKGEPRRAIDNYKMQLAIAREIGKLQEEGVALGNMGLALVDLGEMQQAIEHYEKALIIFQEKGDLREEGNLLGNLGIVYADLGNSQRAFELYKERLKIAQKIGDKRGEGGLLSNLGQVHMNLGEIQQAIECYKQALLVMQEIGDKRSEGTILANLGNAYFLSGDQRRYFELCENALLLFRDIGDRLGESNALGNLGIAHSDQGDIRWAIKLFEQQLAIAREIGYRRGEGKALGNMGNAYRRLGETRRAIGYYEKHLEIAQYIGDQRGEGTALVKLGMAYSDLGEMWRAIDYFNQALAIARKIGDRPGEGKALGNLGNAYEGLGEVRQAIEYNEQALVIFREIRDQHGESITLGNLGIAYSHLGETQRAIEYYELQLTITNEIGDQRGECSANGGLGNLYASLGEMRRAIEYYDKVLAIVREVGDRRIECTALANLGIAYNQLGDTQRAIESFDQHLAITHEIGDRRGEGIGLGNLGHVYAEIGDKQRAIDLYKQQLAIMREIGDRQGEGIACWNISLAYKNSGDMGQAVALALEALRIFEEIEDPIAEMVRLLLAEWI